MLFFINGRLQFVLSITPFSRCFEECILKKSLAWVDIIPQKGEKCFVLALFEFASAS